MKKTFNPTQPVSAYNEWPTEKYPIAKGSMVWFALRGRGLQFGRITWYHPARKCDASSCITPGLDFYKVKIRGQLSEDLVAAKWAQPKTEDGKRKLARLVVTLMRKQLNKLEEKFKKDRQEIENDLITWQKLSTAKK